MEIINTTEVVNIQDNGTTISTPFWDGTTNSTIFGNRTTNSTLLGDGTTNSTLFGDGTTISTLLGDGTTNSTLFGDGTTISTLLGDGTINSTLFGDGTTISTLLGDGTTNSTLFGDGTTNSTLLGDGTTISTLLGDGTTDSMLFSVGEIVMQNLSKPSVPEMTVPLWLSYTVATFACIFLLLGLFGNGMTLVVTLKSETRFKPHNILIMSLAVADTLSLVINTFNVRAFDELSLFDINALYSANDYACKLYNAIARVVSFNSKLMIMLICIERFIVVWLPLKARHILTKRRTIKSVAACVTATLIAATPAAIYGGITDGTCEFGFDMNGDGETDTLQESPLRIVIAALFIVTPTVIIISLTLLTIAKLYRQHAIRRGLTNQESSTGPHRTSVLLTTVVVVYLLLVGIPSLLYVVISIRGTNLTIADSRGVIARLQVGVNIALQANHSTNFILYTMFNKEFRQKLFTMLGCCSCC